MEINYGDNRQESKHHKRNNWIHILTFCLEQSIWNWYTLHLEQQHNIFPDDHPDDTGYLPDGIQKDPKGTCTQIKKAVNGFSLPFGPTDQYQK